MSPVSQMRKLRLAAAPFLPGLASFPSYRLWGESFLSLHTEKAWLSENLLETTSSFLEPTFCIHTEPRVAASTPGLGEGTAVGGGRCPTRAGGGSHPSFLQQNAHILLLPSDPHAQPSGEEHSEVFFFLI